ncbi:MAG: universal stress protein [Vicinamibacterales bacterium]
MLMRSAPDLRLLFPTDFSDACVRASRVIAQLADVLQLDLTIMHAARPGANALAARRALDRFFTEAAQLARCRRVLVETNDPCRAISDLCAAASYDLLVAPDAGRLQPQRFLAGSIRARLLQRCTVPLWTAGGCLTGIDHSRRGLQTIACLVDFDDRPEALLPQVTAFAQRFGARVQALAVLPPLDDGTIGEVAQSDVPLRPGAALTRIQEMFGGDAPVGVDIATGAQGRELPRLLARCGADLLFLGPRQSSQGPWRLRFSRQLDRLPCPVVCVGDVSGLTGRAFHRAVESAAIRRGAVAAIG